MEKISAPFGRKLNFRSFLARTSPILFPLAEIVSKNADMSENIIIFNIDEFLKEFSGCLEPDEFIHFVNNTNSNNEVFIELTILEKLKNKKKLLIRKKIENKTLRRLIKKLRI